MTMQIMPEAHDESPEWPDAFVQRYISAGYWLPQSFADLPNDCARRFADKVAFVDRRERVSFVAFAERVERLAAGFQQWGFVPGDNVVMQIGNRIAFAEIFFALISAGVRPILALPAHRETEIGRFCDTARAAAYITEDDQSGFDYRTLARAVASTRPSLRVIIAGQAQEFASLEDFYITQSVARPRIDPADIACFQLSGGTTGTPKLIPRRHREYLYNARASAELCGIDETSVYLVALPAAHNFPLCCPGFIGTFQAGGRTVFATDPSADNVFPLIRREGVTVTALVPPLALLWTEAVTAFGDADLRSLGLLQVGGAKLTVEGAKRVKSALGNRLQQVFGMAEGLICYTRLDDVEDRIIGTQGSPLSPDDEILIVGPDGEVLPPGVVGSLLTRGPYTIRGYFRAETHNAASFTPDGFYRTGDRARRTIDGDLVIEGRDKDQINRGGEKVSGEEIEDILLGHPSVVDAVVISIPDALLGEKICAFVRAREPVPTAIALKHHVRNAGVAAFKVPDRIEFVQSFPETGVGKTSRNALRQFMQAGRTDKLGRSSGTR